VLFISGEDDEDDTLVPRLIQCGADTSRIAFLSPESQEHFSLAALELLSSVLDQMDGVRFVAIDPPSSYLGTADEHRNAEVRGLLTPIKHWCAQRRVSVVFNSHVNKAIGQNVDSAARVMGSVAWVNAVRAAHMFTKDPDARDEVLFTCIKLNVGAKPQGLAYKITANDGELARLEWLRSVDMDADEAARGERKNPRVLGAAEFLEEQFRLRRAWSSDDLYDLGRGAGVSRSALFEAKKKVPIRAVQVHPQDGGRMFWQWEAMPGWPEETEFQGPEF
jgi:putative DNA primase/helicase